MANQWDRERFIKVFLHESLTWKSLSYDARSLYMHLQRSAGRQATVAMGKLGARGLANALGARLEVVSDGLDELAQAELVIVRGDSLYLPEHEAQQNSSWSEAARKQDQRERKREASRAQQVGGTHDGPNVPSMSQARAVAGTPGGQDVPSMSQHVPVVSTIERETEEIDREKDRKKEASSARAREAPPPPTDPPPATPARAAEPAAKPPPEAPRATSGIGGDLESQLVGLLENDKHLASLHADVATLVERVAYAADAKRPAHVLAAVRKALDVAASSSFALTPTVKTVLAYASKASEADLPSAGGGKAQAAQQTPRPASLVATGLPVGGVERTPEERAKIRERNKFRRACGWEIDKPWPLPEMVAAGWAEGMPWPLPLTQPTKTPADPPSGPANGKEVAQ